MGGFRAKVLGLKFKALGLGFRVQRCVEGFKVAYHPSLILAWGGYVLGPICSKPFLRYLWGTC